MTFLESLAARASGRAEIIQPRPRSLFEPERGSDVGIVESETISPPRPMPSSAQASAPAPPAEPRRAGKTQPEPTLQARPSQTTQTVFIERAAKPAATLETTEPVKSEHHFSATTTVVTERTQKEAPAPARAASPIPAARFAPVVRRANSIAPSFPSSRPVEKTAQPRQAATPPAIHVSIGRIEVRAVAASQPPPRPVRSSPPKPSLEEWLGKRS